MAFSMVISLISIDGEVATMHSDGVGMEEVAIELVVWGSMSMISRGDFLSSWGRVEGSSCWWVGDFSHY